MAPVIHCIRHAQGYHNLTANYRLHDPILTPLGEQQCTTFAASFPFHSQISLIMASPLKRTIHTAYVGLAQARSNGQCKPQILAIPEAQETSDEPCDTGSEPSDLKKACEEKGWPVDLSLVYEGWNVKTMHGRWAPTSDAISKRAKEARLVIREKIRELQREGVEEPEVTLVSHGGFLHYFTEDWEDSGIYPVWQQNRMSDARWDMPGTGWRNTETRSYIFESDGDDDPNAGVVETAESRQRRGKTTPQFGRHVQEQMFQAGMQGWEDQGLQVPTKIGLVDVSGKDKEHIDTTGQAPAVGVKVGA